MPGRWWGAVGKSRAHELAQSILDPKRRQPIIVVTTPDYTTAEHIPQDTIDEAEELRRAVGDIAHIAIVATGDDSFALEDLLPDRWHIFNGFCRSYPADILADPDIHRSPLRRRRRGEVASEQVINDALAHAHGSGIIVQKPKGSVAATGTVTGFLLDGDRAFVDVGQIMPAAVLRDMTFPGIPLDWVIARGATVGGAHDREYNRLVLRKPKFGPDEFHARFPHLSITLALVESVKPDRAVLRVHPDLAVTVNLMDVTSNPLDTLDLFLVEGEVVRARVVHLSSGEPHLRLSDVDEDEPVLPAVTVVEGGTPWLVEGRNMPAPAAEPVLVDPLVEPLAEMPEPVPAGGPVSPPAVPDATGPVRTAPVTPPAGVPTVAPKGATHSWSMKVTALTAENERLRRSASEADALRRELELSRRLLRDTRADLGEAERKIADSRDLHKKAVEELRKARKGAPSPAPAAGPRDRREDWPDDESWLRNEIRLTWIDRVQAAEKSSLPLLDDYAIGSRFAESLTMLDDGQFDKAMRAVVDVLVDRAKDIPGRDLHRLRVGAGGDDAYRIRPEDGAQAWRAAIELNTASARRLHYWTVGGRVELSRVVLHDDMEA